MATLRVFFPYLAFFAALCLFPVASARVGHAQETGQIFGKETENTVAEPETRWDTKSAAILSWYGIDEDSDPSTTLSFDRFREQIDLLTEDGQPVLPLPDIARAIAQDSDLPPMTVALVFEGGRRSILGRAVPLLVARKLPFTVFFASDLADRSAPGYLTWDDLRALQRLPGATIGIHPSAYGRIVAATRTETLRQINAARARFREELGEDPGPTLIAWPFGAYSRESRDVAQEQGFDAALGQQSGVASPASDRFALPRFIMTGDYGDIDRFRTIARALPLPVTGLAPDDPLLSENPPDVGFTVAAELEPDLKSLSCFTSGLGRTKPQIVGKNRVELRFPAPFEPGRLRINCTMPSDTEDPDGAPRWRWLGFLFTVPPTTAEEKKADASAALIPAPDGPL